MLPSEDVHHWFVLSVKLLGWDPASQARDRLLGPLTCESPGPQRE